MTKAAFERESPFCTSGLFAAAVICRTKEGLLHAGILYGSGDSVWTMHLGWEDRLYREWEWPKLWAAPNAEPERLRSVSALCRQIWLKFDTERRFPYALNFRNTRFDLDGSLVLGPGARGLTCATFVLAVFRSFRIELVDEGDWPVRMQDDLGFLEQISRFATPGHYAILEAEIRAGCKRIKPDEVLGACESAQNPACFAIARKNADAIIEKLDSHL